MLRAIREIQPRWVVGENVFGIINWNGGLVFDEVQTDLEAEGYEVQAYVLPACAVNAPHRRDRVWFIAYCYGPRREERREDGGRQDTAKDTTRVYSGIERPCNDGATPNAEHNGHVTAKRGRSNETDSQWGAEREDSAEQLERIRQSEKLGSIRATPHAHEPRRTEQHGAGEPGRTGHAAGHGGGDWHDFPTQSPVCSRDDGFSSRLDGITFSKWRNESIKAAGNAVVPQVVYQIFQAIQQYEHEKENAKRTRT